MEQWRGRSNRPEENDAFDCSDLIVPSTSVLVEQQVQKAIEKWKDLDSRIVQEGDGTFDDAGDADLPSDDDLDDAAASSQDFMVDGTMNGDRRRQRLLPPNFDYRCRNDPETNDVAKVHCEFMQPPYYRPKVISLSDPTQTLDYERELWHVFQSMPTVESLEKIHGVENANDDDDRGRPPPRFRGPRRTLRLKNDLKTLLVKYSRMDAHSLGRLRVRDRHSFPASPGFWAHGFGNALVRDDFGRKDDADRSLQTTVRFEILRHSANLKRGSGPDANRLEVELHGSHHTLLDLHRILVECNSDCGGNSFARVGAHGGKEVPENSDHEKEGPAGVFFIENAFYTHGEIGQNIGEAILHWLDGPPSTNENKGNGTANEDFPSKKENAATTSAIPPRRQYLGLPPPTNEMEVAVQKLFPMSAMKLEDLPLRLGVRYFHAFLPSDTPSDMNGKHIWSLSNESAVFVTGIFARDLPSMQNRKNNPNNPPMPRETRNVRRRSTNSPFPIIIHDMWTSPQRPAICHACDFAVASVVSIHDELADASSLPSAKPSGSGRADSDAGTAFQGTPLCSGCYRELHYQSTNEGSRSVLELRSQHRPLQVFPVENFQRMTSAATLKEVSASAPF